MPSTRQIDGPPAIVLGGMVAALSVARSLWSAGIAVHVIDRGDSPVRFSRKRASFTELRGDDVQGEMFAFLQGAVAGTVVLAASDDGLELIGRHRAEIEALGLQAMEADDDVLLAMLDKSRTYQLARAHGIATPQTFPLSSAADAEAIADRLNYPCVIKPVHSHLFQSRAQSRVKALSIRSPAELREQYEQLRQIGAEMLITEVICGPSDEFVSHYSYLDGNGEALLSFTKRKIRQHPPGFGIGTYHATTHDQEVAAAGMRFFSAVGLRGLGNVEFKRDGRDGELKLIECNPRFTASNELARRSGLDFALFVYCRLAGFPTPPVDDYRDDMRLWEPISDTRAFLAYRRRRELTFLQWARSLAHRQCFPSASFSDPLPALARLAQKAKGAKRAKTATQPARSELPSTGPQGAQASQPFPAHSGRARTPV